MRNKKSRISKYDSVHTMERATEIKRSFEGILDYQKLAKAFGVEKLEKFSLKSGQEVTVDFIYQRMGSKNPTVVKHPGNEGKLNYRFVVEVHRNIGPDNSSYVCLSQYGQPCPLCMAAERLKNTGIEDDYKALSAKKRTLYYILPLVDGVHQPVTVWETAYYRNFGKLLDEFLDIKERKGMTDFCHPEDGYTVGIEAVEEYWNKRAFAKASRLEFYDRRVPIDLELYEKIVETKLDDFLRIPTYETLEALVTGNGPTVEETETDDEFTEPTTQRRRSRRTVTKEEPLTDDENPCPFNHDYGKDFENTDQCKACCDTVSDSYDACGDKYESDYT